jgi:hypothetical protein
VPIRSSERSCGRACDAIQGDEWRGTRHSNGAAGPGGFQNSSHVRTVKLRGAPRAARASSPKRPATRVGPPRSPPMPGPSVLRR